MSIPFDELRQLRSLGLSMSAVLVLAYLNQYGFTPIGKLAEAVGVSVSSVERALAQLKGLGLLPSKMKHDHVSSNMVIKGTNPDLTVLASASEAGGLKAEGPCDPIREKLMAYEVLPWCIDAVFARLERGELRREEVERQLDYHAYRLANGFKFKGHPARYVFSAILKSYTPPEGYHSQRHKAQEGASSSRKVQSPYQHPQTAPEVSLAPEETIKQMLGSPVAGVRRLAMKLAADWGVSVQGLQSVAI